eukprot:1166452-Ditylum_brightwellii.AAC.1
MAILAINRMYQNLKVHFNQEYQLQIAIKSSRQADYHQMNNAEEIPQEDDETQISLEETVQKFANASAADREAFASLTSTNSQLHNTVQELTTANLDMQATLNAMQQQMAMMAVTPPPQVNPTSPQQPQHMFGGRGNYGGCGNYYRGRGRGERGRYQRSQQQVPGLTPAPHMFGQSQGNTYPSQPPPPYPPHHQQQLHQQEPPNLYKRWNNYNYCLSHGFDIPDDHTNQSCSNPKPGHN